MDALESAAERLSRPLVLPPRRLDHVARDAAARRAPEDDSARARARRLRLGARSSAVPAHARARRSARRGRGRRSSPPASPAGSSTRRRWRRHRRRPCCGAATSRTRTATTPGRSPSTSRRAACAWPSRCSTGSARGNSSARCSATASSAGSTTGSSIASSPASAASRGSAYLYFAMQLFNEALALPPGPGRLQRIKEAEIAHGLPARAEPASAGSSRRPPG